LVDSKPGVGGQSWLKMGVVHAGVHAAV